MVPLSKRQKFIPAAFGSDSKTPKPAPHIESINSLQPTEFWSQYCHDIPILAEPRRDSNIKLHPHILSETTLPSGLHDAPLANTFLGFRAASQLSKQELDICFGLIEQTSKADYEASSVGWHPAKKRKEMRLPDLKYLLLMAAPGNRSNDDPMMNGNRFPNGKSGGGNDVGGPHPLEIRGFLSFMPTYEDGHDVLYIYEIHLWPSYQGSGLGTVLMKVAESVAKNIDQLEKMMLTVFRANERARKFYDGLKWSVDEYSPVWVELRGGRRKECDYQIWSKNLEMTKLSPVAKSKTDVPAPKV